MTTEFSKKQPAEAFAISFDFTAVLGTENIASATITAVDQTTLINVSTTILVLANQTNTTKIVYGWVQGGTTGRDYLITCKIIGDGVPASTYELEGILPVEEVPSTVASTGGGTRCVTEPTLEPVTIAELRTHLGLDSGTMATDSTMYVSIFSGTHAVVAAYTLLGTAIDVLGHTAVVYLTPVNNGASGKVDVKIQEADVLAGPYTDWATGAFTQVTEAIDTAIQEKAYTGSKQYIRTVAKTTVADCDFGTSIAVWEPNTSDDDMLNELITAGRLSVENDTGRRLITQTWDYCPKSWPSGDRIKLPFGSLQSITSISYTDTAGTVATMTPTTDYTTEINGNQCGFAVLAYGMSWPSVGLRPSQPITIRFVCGYGSTAASVPVSARQAIKRWCVNNYANRGDDVIGQTVHEDRTYARLCGLVGRLYDMDFL
jgi:uncharacterized phiE125 gp8 family phage protein